MKRRRDRRTRQPAPMQLTARDRAIIEAVHQYRVLRQDQLQALFFGTAGAAQRVLRRLYDHRFLERKFTPVLAGRSPTLYVLDRRGADHLRAEVGYDDLTWYPSSKALKLEFLEHTLAINDFRIAVVLACRRPDCHLERWLGENELKADYDRVSLIDSKGRQRAVAVIPDSYFVIRMPQGRAPFFLEVDRGTETIARFKTKIDAYRAYHASGGYERRYGTRSLRVLTLVPGERRLANLKAAETAGARGRFWFAVGGAVNADTVLSVPIWQVAGLPEPQTLVALE